MPKVTAPSNKKVQIMLSVERKFKDILATEAAIKGIKMSKFCSHILRSYAETVKKIEERKEEKRNQLQEQLDIENERHEKKTELIVKRMRSLKEKS